MFDLNEKKFGGTVIFNNGKGGVAKDVEISVEKRKQDEPDNHPNYKLIVNDGAATVNQGFYYPKFNPDKSEEQNNQGAVREVGRVMHIARAVLGADYTFPSVGNAQEAFDVLFRLISDNAANKKFNVFVSYGTAGYPGKYLGLRYFNFIEPAGEGPSRLRPGAADLLERVEQDAPTDTLGSGSGTKVEKWG